MFSADYDEQDIIENVQAYDPRIENADKLSIPIYISLDELDQLCLYVYTFNAQSITRAALMNVRTLFEILNRQSYRNKLSALARFDFIETALYARLDLNLSTRSLVKQYIVRNADQKFKEIIADEIIKQFSNQSVTNDTAKYINTIVYNNLVYGWVYKYSQEFESIMSKNRNNGYNRVEDLADEFEGFITKAEKYIRQSKKYKNESKGFTLTKDGLNSTVDGIRTRLSAPSNKLRTGIQFLNKMLNGGFESGRSYLFMGVTGVGKSIILLSSALWIKKYNYIPPEEGKKNAVLFISQENSLDETFERIFSMSGKGDDIKNYTTEQIIEILDQSNMLSSDTDDSGSIEFIFEYYNNQEISVMDIDEKIDEYARNGVKVVAVVQDYIERLRPTYVSQELRSTLGSVATELSELAKRRGIPVISAAQLNRTASSVVSDAISNNKTNTIKLLGKQNISESWDIMKNIDCAIIINRETDDTQEEHPEYLGFKLEKFRGKPNKDKLFVFLHPFDLDNGILLRSDLDGEPLSRRTIEEFNPLYNRRQNKLITTKEDDSSFLSYCSNIGADFGEDTQDSYAKFVNMKNLADKEAEVRSKELSEKSERLKRMRAEELKNVKCTIKDGHYHIATPKYKRLTEAINMG